MADRSPRLWNEDLGPSTNRPWGTYSITSIWFACLHNLGVYTAAAGFLLLGLPAWQVVIGIVMGLLMTWGAAQLMANPGFTYGVPLPVVARASFGVFGANIPALIRGVAAVMWYGIQTYLASHAVMILVLLACPSAASWQQTHFLSLTPLGWASFLVTWGLQLFIAENGMEAIRKVQNYAGASVSVVMIILAVGLVTQAGGSVDWQFGSEELGVGETIATIFKVATMMFVVYATMVLNFCDFSRFSPSKRNITVGNFFGLPISGTIFAITIVAVTTSAFTLYGEFITEPTRLIEQVENKWIVAVGSILFLLATLGVNIIANLVSPSYDFANVMPAKINFRTGALVASLLSIVVMPWKIFESPAAVNYFLGTLGAMLGPCFGVIIVDYYLIRRGRLHVSDLYSEDAAGAYHYIRGFNLKALTATGIGVAVAVPLSVFPLFGIWAWLGWYAGTGLAAASYFMMTRFGRRARTSAIQVGTHAARENATA